MQGRLSLRERLVILMVAAVLPIFALSIWFGARETRSRVELAQAQLLFAASVLATSQGKAIDAAEQLLGAISAIPDLRSWDRDRQRCQSYFETLRARYPMYSNIGLLGLDGLPLCHARGTIGDASAADRAYFREALAQRRFVMDEAIVGRLSGRSAIPFALPVIENGEPVAVVFATLDLDLAAQELSRAQLPDGARVMVADRRARVLMEYPAGEGGRKLLRITNHPEVQEAARNRSSGVGQGRDATGVDRVYAYAPSRLVGEEGFIVRVGMARSAALAGGSARLDEMLLLLALATLAAMGVIWWVGGRVIVKPAKQILGTVRRLQQGRLDARVPMPAGHAPRGEFARIGAAFNLMADSLELRQLDLENELGRSRSAYAALDAVLNSMQEALIAVTASGQFLMFNEAAARLFPLAGPAAMPRQWPGLFGFFHADGVTPYELDELPLVRSARGESGRTPLLLVRNALVPEGRMLQCSWQPIRGEGGYTGGLVVFTDVTELERLQAEQAVQFEQLRETQRKLIEAQRIGRVGNWELDLRSGALWWSQEVFTLFGVAPGEFQPTLESFEQCVHPQDRPLLKPARDAALRDGHSVNLEYRIVKPGGAIAWMHEMGEARLGQQGEPAWFGGVVQDITERKLAEQALRESERELQDYTSMLQRAAEAAQLIMAHPTLDATLQEVADQARHVIGSSQSLVTLTDGGPSAPARSFSGDPDGAAPAGSQLTAALVSRDGHQIGRLQVSGRDSGGFTERDEYVLLELAQLAAIAVENARLFTEIRELNAGLEARIAERTAELVQQEKLYRTLAEQAPEVVWNTDATGKLTFMSHAWYELVGGTPADWLGSTGMAALHPDDRAEVAANWLRCAKTLQTFTGVRRVRAKDGSYHTMSYKAAPVLDDNGQVAFWVGIDADITEFKAIERALRSSNQELESFSYSVSHDLRAPLGAIDGFSKALLARLEGHGDERARHYLARIQAGVEKMEQLIDALLSLAKVARAPLHFGAVDLTAIARETLEGLQMQHPERRVHAQVQEGLVAQGDARLLRVLLENLLGNAWKFTSLQREAHIEVARVPDSDAFFVRDDGVGFDMAYAGKLFGPFQRLHTQAEFPGTGIGLATVRRIVARHQGRAWAESRVGEGTTFFFTLSETAPPAWLAGQDST